MDRARDFTCPKNNNCWFRFLRKIILKQNLIWEICAKEGRKKNVPLQKAKEQILLVQSFQFDSSLCIRVSQHHLFNQLRSVWCSCGISLTVELRYFFLPLDFLCWRPIERERDPTWSVKATKGAQLGEEGRNKTDVTASTLGNLVWVSSLLPCHGRFWV